MGRVMESLRWLHFNNLTVFSCDGGVMITSLMLGVESIDPM
jgi:hypothetical protein